MKRKLLFIAVPLVSLVAASAVIGTAAADEITWEACGNKPGAQCGTVEVPHDWSDPDGPTIDLSLVRREATDPDSRVGTLFFNPGGPGVPAAGYVRDYFEQTFSAKLRERFDLIGIDPRGVGGSQQVHCDVPVYDPDVSRYPHSKSEYNALRKHNAEVADSCDPLISDMDSLSVAKDFDAVREALGESTISYLGQSYGTILGTAYAEQFPDRIRTMSLDGVVDHSLGSAQLVADAAAAVEKSFNLFTDWCDTTADCALRDRDVAADWDDLVRQAETAPIPVPDGRPMTAEELKDAAYALLTLAPALNPDLATAIAEARDGDASQFAAIRVQANDDPLRTSAYRATLCMDVDPQLRNYSELSKRLAEAEAAAPHMAGTSEFWDMTSGCLNWPTPPTNPQRPVNITQAPPILLVGNTADPATPLSWAKSLSTGIAGSEVLTYDGVGHTAYGRSTCASALIDTYLVTGELPEEGTVCDQ